MWSCVVLIIRMGSSAGGGSICPITLWAVHGRRLYRTPHYSRFPLCPRNLGCVDTLRLSIIISVISSETRKLNSGIAKCATVLDSSLRCAAFRMTGDKGAAFRMTARTYSSGLQRFVCQISTQLSLCGRLPSYFTCVNSEQPARVDAIRNPRLQGARGVTGECEAGGRRKARDLGAALNEAVVERYGRYWEV